MSLWEIFFNTKLDDLTAVFDANAIARYYADGHRLFIGVNSYRLQGLGPHFSIPAFEPLRGERREWERRGRRGGKERKRKGEGRDEERALLLLMP